MKSILIILGIIISIISFIFMVGIGVNNSAIKLEEQINGAKSSIEVQQKRRIDLLVNLADSVKSYNKYENETMSKIIEARTKASNGNVEESQVLINAIAEQYPELKSQDNYKTYMTELAITENMITEHRNNLNEQIKEYNKFTRTFPNTLFLTLNGYEKIDVKYTEFKDVSTDSPKDLLGN